MYMSLEKFMVLALVAAKVHGFATPEHDKPHEDAVDARLDFGNGLYCNNFGVANAGNTYQNIDNLRKKRGVVVVLPRACRRVACINTSGVYLCNDSDGNAQTTWNVVADKAEKIRAECGAGPIPVPNVRCSNVFSGQNFHNDGSRLNTVVSYANCNHKEYADLPDRFPFPGYNANHC